MKPNKQDYKKLETMTEFELRDWKVPFPKSERELLKIIHAMINRQHDYGTCVYAMSICATATFNYISHKLGATGFQASCADMDILTRTRSMTWWKQLSEWPENEQK